MTGRTYKYFTGEVLYPFGYGLSYSTFEYLQSILSDSTFSRDDICDLKVNIANTSAVPGEEVIQVYAKKENPEYFRPLQSLVGFKKVLLQPHDTVSVEIPVQINQLRYFDEIHEQYRIEPGLYTLLIGSSSMDIRLRISIEVE